MQHITYATTKLLLLISLAALLIVGCNSNDADELTLLIGPEITGCQAEGVRHCMQVQFEAGGEVELFPNPIVGFQYEQGFNYEVRVRRTPIEDTMFDFEYELIEIVSKEEAY